MGNRMSSLPIARFCSGAGKLGEIFAAGRAAAMSTAFHALASGADGAGDLINLLSDTEKEEVSGWNIPEDVALDDGEVLSYAAATCEEAIMMDGNGEFTESEDEAVSKGHPDMYWIVEHKRDDDDPAPLRVCYLADMKKTEFSAADGLESLQLMAYALTLASKYQCDEFAVGVWVITDGTWDWSDRYSMEDFDKTAAILAQVIAAAKNTDGEFCVGPHCRDCWDRLHCKEWLLPFGDPAAKLAAFAKEGGITPDNALEAIEYAQGAKRVLDAVLETLKAYSKLSKGVSDGKGKIWKEVYSKGGKTKFNTTRLLEKLEVDDPKYLSRFSYTTKAHSMGNRWVKEKKKR